MATEAEFRYKIASDKPDKHKIVVLMSWLNGDATSFSNLFSKVEVVKAKNTTLLLKKCY